MEFNAYNNNKLYNIFLYSINKQVFWSLITTDYFYSKTFVHYKIQNFGNKTRTAFNVLQTKVIFIAEHLYKLTELMLQCINATLFWGTVMNPCLRQWCNVLL